MPGPDRKRTVHCIGDLHAGAIAERRMRPVSRHVETLETPALHLQIGDATESGTAREDELALGFLGRLPGPWLTVLAKPRHPSQRAHGRGVGQGIRAEVADLHCGARYARLIVVGPDSRPLVEISTERA